MQYFLSVTNRHTQIENNIERTNERKKWTWAVSQPLCAAPKQIARETCNCLFFFRIQSWLMSQPETECVRQREQNLQKKIIPIGKSFIYFFFSYFLCFIRLIAKLLERCVNLTLNLFFFSFFFYFSSFRCVTAVAVAAAVDAVTVTTDDIFCMTMFCYVQWMQVFF